MISRVTLSEAWNGDADCLNCTIRSSALFSGLSEADFATIHEPVEQVSMKPGEVLYTAGEPGKHLFTIRSGLIKLVRYLPDGTHRIVRLAKTSDVMGLEVLAEPHYVHEAIVLRNTELCRYHGDVVKRLSQTNPVLHTELMNRWQKALSQADSWLTQLSTGSAKKRMANLMLLIREQESDECYMFSREDVGSILSITIETASRLISEFKRKSLINEIRPNYYRLDVPALESIARS